MTTEHLTNLVRARMEARDYSGAAAVFLGECGIKLTIKPAPEACPPWGNNSAKATPPRNACPQCNAVHGNHYRIRLARPLLSAISFDFWGSYADQQTGTAPSDYSVLSCVGMDATLAADMGIDEFVEEYCNGMKHSAAATAFKRAAAMSKQLVAFLSPGELEALQEIS